jgi:hypothetical protein
MIKEEEEASMWSHRLFSVGAAGVPAILAGAAHAEDQSADSNRPDQTHQDAAHRGIARQGSLFQ